MSKIVIFGAKSIALGICNAVQTLYPEHKVEAFLVSSKVGNAETLANLPILECSVYEDKDACVLIATPENVHGDIIQTLEEQEFYNYVCIDSAKEADLMERYYQKMRKFLSIHELG